MNLHSQIIEPSTHLVGRILIIDDEQDIIDELGEALENAGFKTMATSSCAEALRLLRDGNGITHVIVDLCMPELDGLEFIEKVRYLKNGHGIRTIVITGRATVERAIAAMRLGITDFIRKPLDASEIIAAISRQLGAPASEPTGKRANKPVDQREFIDRVIRLRNEKSKIFDKDLIADPVWDMLLDLMRAQLDNQGVPTVNLAIAAGIPISSALRRIAELEQAGMITRQQDQEDRRRVIVNLTNLGREKVERYLDKLAGMIDPGLRLREALP